MSDNPQNALVWNACKHFIKSFIRTELEQARKQTALKYTKDMEDAYERGQRDENEAWLGGERCHICGKEKKRNDLIEMCDRCLEEK